MLQPAMITLIAALAAFSMLEYASAQECPYEPPAGSAERKAIMDTVREPVVGELKQQVIFLAKKLAVCRDWAFLEAKPRQPDGSPLDWSTTPYSEAYAEGMCGGYVHALLVKDKGNWRVRVYEICASDVPWVTWAEEYGAPPELFPNLY
jgi:hypothetical protein